MQDGNYQSLLAEVRNLIGSGGYDAARSACSKLCETHPQQVGGWLLLGWICSETGAFGEALSSFQNATRLKPECADAYLGMGVIYQQQNDLQSSLSCYTRALDLRPDSVAAQYNIGLIQERQGKFDAALKSYQDAHAMDSTLVDPLLAQATVYERMGKPDEAERILTPLIENGVKSIKAGVTFSRICTHTGQCRRAIEYLQSMQAGNMNKNDRIDLHFTLGRLYDRSGDYDTAFKHYRLGNSTHGSSYDNAADNRYLDALIREYGRQTMAPAPSLSRLNDKPVFIVGMPRSGTSLVEQILASHPEVAGGGELPDIIQIAGKLNAAFGLPAGSAVPVSRLTPALVDQHIDGYLSVLEGISATALRITDKMPHNFLHLGMIRTLFPAAKIIHCVRHPMDTCLSCYFQRFAGSTMPCSYDLNNMAHHYNHYQQLMNFWENTVGITMLEVRYEELVSDQHAVTRQLVEYCGLQWDENCIQFHKAKHVTRTASYNQVRSKLYSTSSGRWKHYEKYLAPLKNTLKIPA